MTPTASLIKYLISVVVVAAILGLGGWYLYLRTQSGGVRSEEEGRGFGIETPSFTGSAGNTYENIQQFVSGNPLQNKAARGAPPPQLWHVTFNPVAGADFVQTSDGEELYFVERASGNVFAADILSGEIERLTNTLIPKVYKAAFSQDGGVVFHTLNQYGRMTLFTGVVVPPTQTDEVTGSESLTQVGALEGQFFGAATPSFAVDPDARHIVYLRRSPDNGWVGVRRAWDGTGEKTLFETGMYGWRMYWLHDDRLVVSQSAADNVPGYAYEVGKGGVLKPLLRDIPGLVIAPRLDLQSILFSSSKDGSLALFAKNGDTIVPIPLKTVADKCVWAPIPDANLPRDAKPTKTLIAYCAVPQELAKGDILNNWYKGRYHTVDAWWRVDASTGVVEQLTLPSEAIDVENPSINKSGTALSFMNYSDKSLWVLQIPAPDTRSQ